jgi:hypothetical protein
MAFSGGPRACVAYRFALTEYVLKLIDSEKESCIDDYRMKAIIFTLVRAFDIDLGVSPDDVLQKTETTTKPVLKSDPERVNQLPLIIRPLEL